MKISIAGLTLLSVLVAGPASAQSSDKDVRCVVAANIFNKVEKDEPKKQLAGVTGLYFLGRADARLSPAQFKAAIIAEQKTLNQTTLGPAMTSCAQTFQARQKALVAMSQAMAQAAKK